jgi:hypothetical protein
MPENRLLKLAQEFADQGELYRMHRPQWDDDFESHRADRAAIFLLYASTKHLRDDLLGCVRTWETMPPRARRSLRQLAKELFDFMDAELPNDKV